MLAIEDRPERELIGEEDWDKNHTDSALLVERLAVILQIQ